MFAAFVILAFGLTTAGFPLLPRHLTLAATVTVGIPGFVIALIPSEERPDQGSFLRRVARFSIPAGAVMAAAVLAAYLLERAVRVRSITDARTAAVTVFVALGLYLLLVLDPERMSASRSYAIGIVSLVGALGGRLPLDAERRAGARLLRPRPPRPAGRADHASSRPWPGIRLMAWAGLSPYPRLPPTAPPEPSRRATRRHAAGLRLRSG